MHHIQIAMDVIKHLDPRPGLRYSGPAPGKWSQTFTSPKTATSILFN